MIRILFALMILATTSATAQKLLRSVSMTDTIRATAIDRPGDFYALTGSGQIQKFNADGDLQLLYKADTLPTLFDPRDGARLFAYYRNGQRYRYLSPSFKPLASYKLDPSFAIQPWLICPSGERKLWILDQADNSLKKVDVRTAEVEIEVRVDADIIDNARRYTAMRDYQGFLFLLDPKKGIDVFNTLGLHLRTIGGPGIRSFNFLGEDLYYANGNHLVYFNLFTAASRTSPIPAGYREVLVTEDRLILFQFLRADIYSIGQP